MQRRRSIRTFAAALMVVLGAKLTAQYQLYGDIYNDLESRSLTRHRLQHLCQREVPAIFFQTVQDEPVRGNGSSIFYHRIEVCCEGSKRAPYAPHHCVPDCSRVSPDNCRNGFCRSPGPHCECFAEFVQNERGACIHTCPISCQYGRCYLNGTCACHPSYTLDHETRLFCRPHCEQSCGTHQECVAPGKCDCIPGYRLTQDLGCQPVCTPDCGHGKCVGPNNCQCFPGYMKRPQRNVCEAECYINCENGFCETRYKCQCREGYHYDLNTTSCLPECNDNCNGNGICVSPGICRCFEGFSLRGSTCEAKCLRGCGHYGHCIAPNVCGCGPSKQHCLYGSCDARGNCVCPPNLVHFVDKCLSPQQLENGETSNGQEMYYNQQFSYEFNALIGRLFNWI